MASINQNAPILEYVTATRRDQFWGRVTRRQELFETCMAAVAVETLADRPGCDGCGDLPRRSRGVLGERGESVGRRAGRHQSGKFHRGAETKCLTRSTGNEDGYPGTEPIEISDEEEVRLARYYADIEADDDEEAEADMASRRDR